MTNKERYETIFMEVFGVEAEDLNEDCTCKNIGCRQKDAAESEGITGESCAELYLEKQQQKGCNGE